MIVSLLLFLFLFQMCFVWQFEFGIGDPLNEPYRNGCSIFSGLGIELGIELGETLLAIRITGNEDEGKDSTFGNERS